MGKRREQELFIRLNINGQQVHEKIIRITRKMLIKTNCNLVRLATITSFPTLPPGPPPTPFPKKNTVKDVEEKIPHYIIPSRNIFWNNHLKNSVQIPQKDKYRSSIWPSLWFFLKYYLNWRSSSVFFEMYAYQSLNLRRNSVRFY